MRQGQPQAAVAGFDMLEADRRQFGAAQGAGKADQQQRAVAQSGQVVADRGQDLAQDVGGDGELLGRQFAGIGGGAADAGHGFRDLRLGGGHWAAGDEMQVADRGAAQVQRVDAKAAAALGGQEGDHIGGARRQAGQLVLVAPVAPGAHAGTVGAAGVVRFGAAGIGLGRQPGIFQCAIGGGDAGLGGGVEPQADFARGLAERRRGGARNRRQDRGSRP